MLRKLALLITLTLALASHSNAQTQAATGTVDYSGASTFKLPISITAGGQSVTFPAGGGTLLTSGITSLPSLATVGTLTAGTWNATVIGATYGGTGQDSHTATGIAQLASGVWSFSVALANGTTATTQSNGDNSTKVATTAYVAANAITNPCTLLGSIIYQGSSVPVCLVGATAPNGVPSVYISVPSGGVATAIALKTQGVGARSGVATTDSIAALDRNTTIVYSANSTVTIPVAGTSNSTDNGFTFILVITGSAVTDTFNLTSPSTATIVTGTAPGLSGQTTFALTSGQRAAVTVDPSGTNWLVTETINGSGGSGSVANCATQFGIFWAASTGTTATCNPNLTGDAGNSFHVGGTNIDINGGLAAYGGTFGNSGYVIYGIEGTGPSCKVNWDLMWTDSTSHGWSLCDNNGSPSLVATQFYVSANIPIASATGAVTAPIEVGYVTCTQATPCAGSATTLFTTGGSNSLYRADVSADCTSSASLASISVTLTYTDPSGTVQTSSIGSAAVCTTLGASSIMNFSLPFVAKNATAIQYNVTTANSPSYQARVAIFQESLN